MAKFDPFRKVRRMVLAANRIANKEGREIVFVKLEDIGDWYHVYGINATAKDLYRLLSRRYHRTRKLKSVPSRKSRRKKIIACLKSKPQ